MVFYRKYRNQTIDELDNAHVREVLSAVLAKPENIPHAFLFTGPKGLGKTSSARIVAKVINCVGRNQEAGIRKQKKEEELNAKRYNLATSIEPCNACEQCISITNGTNLDVYEIDGASNRGIDEIRDLKEKIRLTPLNAKKKIYIIDEVHMLTTEAFNALLKTLEEPPPHAMFMLCTTEAHKIPETVFSRCFHIGFTKATDEELVRSFKRIIKGEGIESDSEALFQIAKLSDGGFRDGTKILEEIVALADGKKITKELVEQRYKSSSILHFVSKMIEVLEKKNVSSGFKLVEQAIGQGIDVKYFIQQIMESLHEELIAKVGQSGKSESKKPHNSFDLEELKSLLSLLDKAYAETKNAVLPQLPLELLVAEWAAGKTETDLESEDQGVTVVTLRKQVGDLAKIKALYGEVKEEKKVSLKSKVSDISLLNFSAEGEITKEWMDNFWNCIISAVKDYNHTLAGVLRGCGLKSFDRKTLIIETAYKFHKEKLDSVQTMKSLEDVCRELTGVPVKVSIVLKK